MSPALEHQEVRVKGTVQGVGFRPVVYRLAIECALSGEVSNDTDGVLIRLSGMQENIGQFLQRLPGAAPPLAKIESIEAVVVDAPWQYRGFCITRSIHTSGHTDVTADAALCAACSTEIYDADARRYLYPFTNCTHCGPRLSIVRGIPYDRPNTTMANFPLCPRCLNEYQNPLDRRFHAQPIACHQCGPRLTVHTDAGSSAGRDSEQVGRLLESINQALLDGRIVAIKGLGGFHLCCDAGNHASVELLRERKRRYAKPLALMTHDLLQIEQYCKVSPLEKSTLQSPAAPIVLLETRAPLPDGVRPLSSAIAPASRLLGWMLPYTPLHHLVCRRFGQPLVMTSGNASAEPQIIDNRAALDRLGAIADVIVCHDRDIANRIDDSVVCCVSGRVRVLRRARGYAPRSIRLPRGLEQADRILAYGAQLKATFCLVKQGVAILSQHQGDLEEATTIDDYEKNLALYVALYEFTPRWLALDKHPEYVSSKLAKAQAAAHQLASLEIQHHHAHIASVMVENQLSLAHGAVLGIAFDGLGFGADGSLWGGEFLLADYRNFQRVARLKPVAMPGAAQAVMQPWRNTVAHILNSMSWQGFMDRYGDTSLAKWLSAKPIGAVQAMLADRLNSPLASSAGRLFDAVAGALQLNIAQVQFEGQAAITLEMLADKDAVLGAQRSAVRRDSYAFTLESAEVLEATSAVRTCGPLIELNAASIWPALLRDLQHGVEKSAIATRFHIALIDGVLQVIDILAKQYAFDTVALSGGCMQNAILLQGLEQGLKARRLTCISNAEVPANDGGIALGQAAIAAARIATGAARDARGQTCRRVNGTSVSSA